MSFVVFTDGSANLPASKLDGITLLPCSYTVEGVQKEYLGDVDSFDAHAYYEQLKSGCKVTTSLLNTHLFLSHFRTALEQGQDVIYIAMSSGISGTYQAAICAKHELEEEFPDRFIHIVDSRGCGFGSGLLAIRAEELSHIGTPVRQAAAMLDADVPPHLPVFHRGRPEFPEAQRTGGRRNRYDWNRTEHQTHSLRDCRWAHCLLRQGSGPEKGH